MNLKTKVGGLTVSTVELGDTGDVFETIAFNSLNYTTLEGTRKRYTTKAEATSGHYATVEKLKGQRS